MEPPVGQIALNPAAIARALGAVAVLLVLASVAMQVTVFLTGHDCLCGLVRFFNVDAEMSLPTCFSTLLLLSAALLLAAIAVLERRRKAAYVSHWVALSFGFLFMAVDEAVALHEMLTRPAARLLGDGASGVFRLAWVVPGIALVVVLAVVFLKFLLHLPVKTRLRFLMAAILYVGGAIGLELIGGCCAPSPDYRVPYMIVATVEESLEMAGAIVFIWALLEHIADNHGEVRVRLDGARGEVATDGS